MKARRIVVITGGSAGIGRATARAFGRAGDAVALLARGEERLADAVAELRGLGVPALGLSTDVADAGCVEEAAERIERELGPIDVWVNNAMATIFAPFHAVTDEEFRRVTEVTYLGAVNGTRAALRRMRARDRGCIVQVGSALAYRSIPLQSPYCGAKAAIRAFSDAVRSELIHDRSGVRICMLQLSAFNTPQFDWGRSRLPRRLQPVPPIFQPEIAAAAIVRAAGGSRREWWVGWPAARAILSSRVVPGLGDRLAAKLAYEGQLTGEPADPGRVDNLFDAVPGRQGARGRFDPRARTWMWQPWLSAHRVAVTVAVVVIVVIAGLAVGTP
jgi:NAD(P)-dependent dehydrogenase (short-subunit alcohol dehydrogenase family)